MGEQELDFVNEAFATNWIAPAGPHVNAFESEFAQAVGSPCAAAVSSGTAALHLALMLSGVGRGDEVLCSTLTFVASANPIVQLGAIPVFIDSEARSWNMDPVLLRETLARKAAAGCLPKAVVLVHLYGQCADLDPILGACEDYGVPLIEDAAEALGATYYTRRGVDACNQHAEKLKTDGVRQHVDGESRSDGARAREDGVPQGGTPRRGDANGCPERAVEEQSPEENEMSGRGGSREPPGQTDVQTGGLGATSTPKSYEAPEGTRTVVPGTLGLIGIYSFNGNKIITTSGGGMMVTADPAIADRARFLATQARDPAPHYEHSAAGFNHRMSSVLAGNERGQLQVLADRGNARRANGAQYVEGLSDLPGLCFMPEAEFGRSTRWLTCFTIDPVASGGVTREQVRLTLEREDIEARPVWKPMHMQPLFADAEAVGGGVAERLFADGLCVPSGSNLARMDLDRVISLIQGGPVDRFLLN